MIKGDAALIKVEFRDASKALFDPDTVTIKCRDSVGNEYTFTYPATEVVKTTTGKYEYTQNVNVPGTWVYRWEGTGSQQAAGEGTFIVEDTKY